MSEENKGVSANKKFASQEEKTITIKKADLWKYSTFVLLAAIVIVFIVTAGGNDNPGAGNVVAPAQQPAVNLKVFEDATLFPSLGPEDAENVVIEFADFQCPWCAVASGLPQFAKDAKETNPSVAAVFESAKKVQEMAANGEIRFIYVSMSFLGPESVYAAQAGLCANEQGKFWEIHDKIFIAHDGEENNGKYSKEKLKVMAAGISGMDTGKFNSCLDNDETLGDVQSSSQIASSAASGTPTFYVNGVKTSASSSAIQAALA